MSANNQLDNLIGVASSQSTNQQQIISIVQSYAGGMGQQPMQLALFSLPNSKQAIDDAVSIMGLPPYSTNGGRDWANGMLNFYGLVKYLKTYPLPTNSTNCTQAKTASLALDAELTSIDKNRAIGGTDDNYNRAYTQAVNTIKQYYDGWYSTNNCDLVISQQASEFTQNLSNKSTQQNAAMVIQDTTPASTSNNTLIYGIMGAVALVIVVLVVIKTLKKD